MSTSDPKLTRCATPNEPLTTDPRAFSILAAFVLALVLILLTRVPVARSEPMESDEFGFLERISAHWFPMHHTLFLTTARLLGTVIGDSYRGFILLDMVMSAVAVTSLWWWLRALVAPRVAAAGAGLLFTAPLFWGYGAVAGNYTAIIAVGSFLLGAAFRGRSNPSSWHPAASAIVLAAGTGYRQDLGTFWLPVFLVILWQHRWRRAVLAGILFALANLAWLIPMLNEAGGWTRYRASSADFAYNAGYLNSVWSLGLVDAPVRYAAKLGMALAWTLGPALLLVPRGFARLRRLEGGPFLAWLLPLSMAPALASHLLVHFGVQGYAFHYVPALMGLIVIGAGPRSLPSEESNEGLPEGRSQSAVAATRLSLAAAMMAGLFLFYPTDFQRPGWRGNFDLAFARHTRAGLLSRLPLRQPTAWRTANSRVAERSHTGPRTTSARSL